MEGVEVNELLILGLGVVLGVAVGRYARWWSKL